MAQDLRKLFEKEREKQSHTMRDGHEARFLERLNEEMPEHEKPKRLPWIAIAASLTFLVGLSTYFFSISNSKNIDNEVVEVDNKQTEKSISLGDLSPDLEKIENYYVTNINLQLARLQISDENKGLVDSYLEKLAELDLEYKSLNEELNTVGPNNQTINALITNLQLRLQLLQKLKDKLNQLNSSKNEQQTHSI